MPIGLEPQACLLAVPDETAIQQDRFLRTFRGSLTLTLPLVATPLKCRSILLILRTPPSKDWHSRRPSGVLPSDGLCRLALLLSLGGVPAGYLPLDIVWQPLEA